MAWFNICSYVVKNTYRNVMNTDSLVGFPSCYAPHGPSKLFLRFFLFCTFENYFISIENQFELNRTNYLSYLSASLPYFQCDYEPP